MVLVLLYLQPVAGQTYQWSVGGTIMNNSSSFFDSPTTTTTYQLTVTQYGCSATDNVTVTVNDAPNVGVSGGSSQQTLSRRFNIIRNRSTVT